MVEDANAVILTFGSYRLGITQAKDGKPSLLSLLMPRQKKKDTSEFVVPHFITKFVVFLCRSALITTGRGPFTKGLGLENINVVTQRGFVLVDERMQVPHLYCIDDANEKMILAYAASAQGISVVEQVSGKDHVLNHLSIPAACFTHLEISNGWTHRAMCVHIFACSRVFVSFVRVAKASRAATKMMSSLARNWFLDRLVSTLEEKKHHEVKLKEGLKDLSAKRMELQNSLTSLWPNYPYVTGTSVIGIKFKDGILMAADMGGSSLTCLT
ncbi:hypothetical protein LOK49_LG01G02178 [Camellia lanceoleosa]|uniref:Uncharacterized protein n=1 Tax=Camellia lanceoleosa TaxID=1840588 RepID=A0ACC0IXX1_9ERIC|nr:hypothetical protein LOK49_LG01G02178 [Camellia lanceoleosa]